MRRAKLKTSFIGYGHVQFRAHASGVCLDYLNYDGANVYDLLHFIEKHDLEKQFLKVVKGDLFLSKNLEEFKRGLNV